MKQSDNESTDMVIPQYVKFGLKQRVLAGKALNEGDREKFKEHLSLLYNEFFSKFYKRDDVERPSFAEKEGLVNKEPVNVGNLNWTQQKSLYFQICKLQEKLEYTSIESSEWEGETI
jgi:hypothetical protein